MKACRELEEGRQYRVQIDNIMREPPLPYQYTTAEDRRKDGKQKEIRLWNHVPWYKKHLKKALKFLECYVKSLPLDHGLLAESKKTLNGCKCLLKGETKKPIGLVNGYRSAGDDLSKLCKDLRKLLVCIIHQKDTKSAVEWARDAIEQVSKLITADFDITTLGSWSIEELHDRNFIEGLDNLSLFYRAGQVNCNCIVSLAQREFLYSKKCGSVLYLVSEDMFLNEKNTYVVGGANTERPAVVSTYRFSTPEFEDMINGMLKSNGSDQLKEFISRDEHKGKKPSAVMRIECTKTVVMHELGHVLGLIPDGRKENIQTGDTGTHCKNSCVMRGGLDGLGDWIEYTLNRQLNDPYCSKCLPFLISRHS
jgi:predicted Zn-dependent protease